MGRVVTGERYMADGVAPLLVAFDTKKRLVQLLHLVQLRLVQLPPSSLQHSRAASLGMRRALAQRSGRPSD